MQKAHPSKLDSHWLVKALKRPATPEPVVCRPCTDSVGHLNLNSNMKLIALLFLTTLAGVLVSAREYGPSPKPSRSVLVSLRSREPQLLSSALSFSPRAVPGFPPLHAILAPSSPIDGPLGREKQESLVPACFSPFLNSLL